MFFGVPIGNDLHTLQAAAESMGETLIIKQRIYRVAHPTH